MPSDFFSNAWSIAIAVVVLVSILSYLLLLLLASRRKVMADDNTTGHVWDVDLREMNNPLPMWWVGLFVITVLFSLAYVFMYPGLGSNPGSLGWTSVGAFEQEQAKAREEMQPVYAGFAALSPEALAANHKAMAIGERLFLNNCAQCHGSDARGSKGFPNLTDGDWIGGQGIDYVMTTIRDGRTGTMPPMAAAVGGPEDIRNVAHYVLSLSGSAHNTVAAQLGKPKFATCAACHGPTGTGNPALGAPNLTDKIWLHGWGEQTIVSMVTQGKTSVMPAHASRFTPEQTRVLAAYVLSLSQGQPGRAAAATAN